MSGGGLRNNHQLRRSFDVVEVDAGDFSKPCRETRQTPRQTPSFMCVMFSGRVCGGVKGPARCGGNGCC